MCTAKMKCNLDVILVCDASQWLFIYCKVTTKLIYSVTEKSLLGICIRAIPILITIPSVGSSKGN